jgi:hypothetical protein
VALLLAIAIIGIIIWQKDLFTNGLPVPVATTPSGDSVNAFGTQIDAVQKAKQAKLDLEAELQDDASSTDNN